MQRNTKAVAIRGRVRLALVPSVSWMPSIGHWRGFSTENLLFAGTAEVKETLLISWGDVMVTCKAHNLDKR